MNLAHLHIVLNHVPSLGSIAGLLLLVAGIYKKDESIKQFAYFVLVLITMAVLPTYISGAEAQKIVRNGNPAYSPGLVQLHQNAAMVTLLLMTATGAFAWFGLWEYRRFAKSGPLITNVTLILTTASAAVVLLTASIGGKISHPEIRDAADAAITPDVGWRPLVESWIGDHPWSWPTLEMSHYVGMALLFGVAVVFLFRMLGLMKGISFQALHRLMPMGIIGFVINVLTGFVFYAAAPPIYLGKPGYLFKMLAIVITTIPMLYFTMSDEPWKVQPDGNVPAMVKFAAVGLFLLVVTVMIYGRLIFTF